MSALSWRAIGRVERRRRKERRRERRRLRRTVAGRHPFLSAFIVVVLGLTPVWASLGSALTNPGLGSSLPARFAEWAREHGFSSVVVAAERFWYSHHQPPVGGRPPKGAIPPPVPGTSGATGSGGATPGSRGAGSSSGGAAASDSKAAAGASGRDSSGHGASASSVRSASWASLAALSKPGNIRPIASPPIPGEGVWHPYGRPVDGVPAVYEAFLRPDAIHTSLVVGVAWMDPRLLRATLYSGSTIPGGGPYPYTAPITHAAARTLVAAFNAGFLMGNANGGYYTDGKVVIPLRTGAASFVVYRNGGATVEAWPGPQALTPSVVAVRQNLDLLVKHGAPVPGLNANDTTVWGATLGNQIYVWRSGLGVTADGALVYVGGPGLNITSLASLLVRAGAVRAMELDINTDWVNLTTYHPARATGPATPSNGTEMLPEMSGTPARYFESWWSRDFITMSARSAPAGGPGGASSGGGS